MPKKFLVFLIVAQAFLTFFHWLIYKLLTLFFFSFSYQVNRDLLIVLMLLSLSFLFFSILTHNRDNKLLTFGYVLSGVWIVLGFYFVLASILALFIFLYFDVSLTTLGLASIVFAIVMSIYGLINARIARVVKLTITLPNLPASWKGKTAVMASDLHLGQVLRNTFAKKVVRMINKLNPDIVFIPGDFYDGVHTDFAELAEYFKQLKAPLGVYFASGNHEMLAGYGKCEEAIRNSGIKILEDQKVEIDGLQIVGLAYKPEDDQNVADRLKALSLDQNKPSILLKHVPNHFQPIEQSGINFQLSGHSHHGQLWPFRYITHRIWKGFDYGLKKFGKLQVYTSSGVGTWGPPMRTFTKSEILKITFQ